MNDKLSLLYEDIRADGIKIVDYSLPDTPAVTIKLYGKYAIFLDRSRIKTTAQELCTIAHEYGHFLSGATHRVDSPHELIERHEYRAQRCAVHLLVPFSELKKAVDEGCTEVWQLAEYFGVTEETVLQADDIYRREELIPWSLGNDKRKAKNSECLVDEKMAL